MTIARWRECRIAPTRCRENQHPHIISFVSRKELTCRTLSCAADNIYSFSIASPNQSLARQKKNENSPPPPKTYLPIFNPPLNQPWYITKLPLQLERSPLHRILNLAIQARKRTRALLLRQRQRCERWLPTTFLLLCGAPPQPKPREQERRYENKKASGAAGGLEKMHIGSWATFSCGWRTRRGERRGEVVRRLRWGMVLTRGGPDC